MMNGEGRKSERARQTERDREGMHTSRFPRAARCKRRASRAHLYVSSEGNGISQGLLGLGRLGAIVMRERGVNGGWRGPGNGAVDDCGAGRVTVTTGAWHDGQPERGMMAACARLRSRASRLLGKSFLVLQLPSWSYPPPRPSPRPVRITCRRNAIVSWRDTSRDL